MRFLRAFIAVVCLGVVAILVQSAQTQDDARSEAPAEFATADVEFFEKDVLPILKAHCFKCHGGEPKVRSGFRLTSREGLLKGGELGEAVDLKNPSESEFIKAINYDGLEMPPAGRLKKLEVETLTKWIKLGTPWSKTKDYGVKEVHEEDTRGDGRDYWAYQPVTRPKPPKVKNADWVRNPIDRFILARLENAGLTPTKPADRIALIRRAYYDLTGLPPKPEQVDNFLNDKSPEAWEKVIDRLLESPQYGEKWGRHWLDLVRYAETHGYERDSPKPFAWRFRDYVIDSFNKDKPYDQFIIEQLAGDELPEVTQETLTATGYYRLGIWDDEPADRPLARYDGLDDIVKTTGEVVLAMTLGCARCHSHKVDPIDHNEYYSFVAWFHDVTHPNRDNLRHWVTDESRLEHEKRLAEKQLQEGRLYSQIYALEQEFLAKLKTSDINAGTLPRSDLEDVRFRFYRDTWEKLPRFDEIKPEDEGSIAGGFLSLAPASRREAIGLVFEAKLKVPADGQYRFTINSTEGARLLLNGKEVIKREGKGSGKVDGEATLKAGLVPLRLEYFNTYERPRLTVTWSGKGMKTRWLTDDAPQVRGPVLAEDSRKQPQTWAFTTSKPAAGWMKSDFDDKTWKRGAGGFGTPGTPGIGVKTEWRTPDIWLRRSFNVNKTPEGLSLDLYHDEDVEVYLNGTRIHAAKGYVVAYKKIALSEDALKALKPGRNVLAVHCRQTGGGQGVDVGLSSGEARFDFAATFNRHADKLLGEGTVKRRNDLVRQLDQTRKRRLPPVGTPIMSVAESGRTPTRILLRGNPHVPGDVVPPRVPVVLRTEQPVVPDLPANAQTSRKRLTLAEWLVSKDNPLTARVFANRLWFYHFGRGIVPTPNDFGKLGELPTHPQLLDWLASELMDGEWKIKRMHKLIMMSATYQMASQGNERALLKDPGNNLFWRFNMRRLSAEEIRDSILAATGELNLKQGGPSIYVPIPREVLQGQSRPGAGWGNSSPEEAARRSVYIHVKRSLLVPILEMHDQADTDSSCPVRYVTTVPTQSLGMLNGEFSNRKARKLAERLRKDAPDDLDKQLRLAIRLTTSRQPDAQEVADDWAFILKLQAEDKLTEEQALTAYCLLILNTNEFVYLD